MEHVSGKTAFITGGSYDLSRDTKLKTPVDEGTATNDADRRVYAQAFQCNIEQAYFLSIFTSMKTNAFSLDLNFKPYLDDNPCFYRSTWR